MTEPRCAAKRAVFQRYRFRMLSVARCRRADLALRQPGFCRVEGACGVRITFCLHCKSHEDKVVSFMLGYGGNTSASHALTVRYREEGMPCEAKSPRRFESFLRCHGLLALSAWEPLLSVHAAHRAWAGSSRSRILGALKNKLCRLRVFSFVRPCCWVPVRRR